MAGKGVSDRGRCWWHVKRPVLVAGAGTGAGAGADAGVSGR